MSQETFDPTRSAQLDRIEADIALMLSRMGQLAAAIGKLWQDGGERLSELENAGRDRLDEIEGKIDKLIGGRDD